MPKISLGRHRQLIDLTVGRNQKGSSDSQIIEQNLSHSRFLLYLIQVYAKTPTGEIL